MACFLLLQSSPNNRISTIFAQAKVACQSTAECEQQLLPGSSCVNGYCDNPFQYGCLYSQHLRRERERESKSKDNDNDDNDNNSNDDNSDDNQHRRAAAFIDSIVATDQNKRPALMRICHSEDPPDAVERGLCRAQDITLTYPETRIMGQNWESPFFEAWLLQILMSEVLNVPVTIETGVDGKNVNFYDPEMRFDYGVAYDWGGLQKATEVGDCRKVPQHNKDGEYQGCGHAILEIWSGVHDIVDDLEERDITEPKEFIGVVGQEGWVIPKYTAMNDSSLLSHFGLMGQHNRRKLAERFLRPTTWNDYCREESPVNCTADDGVAARAPVSHEEGDKYFVAGLYTGHFRKTKDNDCDTYPDTCTGHFVDYPCGWTSFFEQQVRHLDIALKSDGEAPNSGGYSYNHMVEIIFAANYTRSDVAVWWWRPEALYLQFQGTDFEFQHVVFPPTNHVCVDNRVSVTDRCEANATARAGHPEGVCDTPPIPNFKVLSKGLYKMVYDPKISDGERSPAYDVIKEFTIDGFQLGEIFDYWTSRNTDKYGFDPRDALCEWAYENFDYLEKFIPRTFPREVEEEEETGIDRAAIAFGSLAVVASVIATIFVIRQRKRRVFQFAQVEFVFLLLLGMLLVSAAAVVSAIAPTDLRCVASVWLLNVGYSMELVPLVVKIAAINRLMSAAKNLKRIKLGRSFLFGIVAALTACVVVYMALWTAIDPPSRASGYTLTNRKTDSGSTIVLISQFCESGSKIWMLVAVGVQGFLLTCASMLAFLTRKMPKDINEANTISFLIYWNFVCVLLRAILLLLADQIGASKANQWSSCLLSADSVATCLIYFLPKFLGPEDNGDRGSSLHTNRFVSVGFGLESKKYFSSSLRSHQFFADGISMIRGAEVERNSRSMAFETDVVPAQPNRRHSRSRSRSSVLPNNSSVIPAEERYPTEEIGLDEEISIVFTRDETQSLFNSDAKQETTQTVSSSVGLGSDRTTSRRNLSFDNGESKDHASCAPAENESSDEDSAELAKSDTDIIET